MPFIYQQLQTQSNLRKLVVVVKGLEIKPYLLRNAVYASPDYLLCNFKLVDENLDKLMFNQRTNVNRVKIKNDFEILKKRWMILHYINARINGTPKIVVACCVLRNYYQLMRILAPVTSPQVDLLCGARGQVPFACEGRTNWMSVYHKPI
jgi:hypothetical protein